MITCIPLSYMAEYSYCPRSTYHLLTEAPRVRDENAFIQSGRHAHQSVDAGYRYTKSAKTVESSLWVYSEHLRVRGKVDIVEFYSDQTLVPIEVKRGAFRENRMHVMQLSLMALCLKEMFPQYRVESGAVFYKGDRKKKTIVFTKDLLKEAEYLAQEVSRKIEGGVVPKNFPPSLDERCEGCCFCHLCYLED